MDSTTSSIEGLNNIRPYENSLSLPLSHLCRKTITKLDCNEAPYPPSSHVRRRLIEFIENDPLNWYPDTQSHDLKQKLSEYIGYPPEYILTFNGCDHALDSLCRAYLTQKDEVIFFSPTYDNFRFFVELTGARIIPYFSSFPFQPETKNLEKLTTPNTKIIYLANPNNPTGTTYTEEQIRHILNASKALVIVDEAYFEFWGKTSLPLIKEFSNLVITRSFSKAFGLAGLRCGYLVTNPCNIRTIEKVRNGKSINALAQLAAKAALEDLAYIKEQVRCMHEVKNWCVNVMRASGVPVVDTVANFILIKVRQPNEVEKALMAKEILVRNRSCFPQLEGYLRITIGLRSEMEKFAKAISSIKTELLSAPLSPQAAWA